MDAPNPKTISSRLARVGLRLLGGWSFEGPYPPGSKSVMLAGPHTSNLDGLLLVLLTRSIGLSSSWMVKDTWTKPPIGWLTKRVGAVGVNRREATGMVGQMTAEFDQRESFHLMIPPEGTRSYADHWKSGFYRIALDADVPVMASYLDYRRKRGGIGAPHELTGDASTDMDHFRREYAEGKAMARYPDKYGPIRLRDES